MPRPHRRGSHSSNMLRPSVSIIQSQHNADGSERRRISLPTPNLLQGMGSYHQNGGISMAAPQQQAGVHPNVQQLRQQQPQSQVHSVASAMDLISSSSQIGQSNGNRFPPQHQNNLFQSSSHHTSHTAAAGDLLSMSRRALDPPTINQNSLGGKKRSSTMTDDPDGNDVNMNGSTFNGPQHDNLHQSAGAHQVTTATPAETSPFHLNGFSVTGTTKLYNNVSTSTFASQGGMDESYQQHRTIRRCQRSDSFEMMDDG